MLYHVSTPFKPFRSTRILAMKKYLFSIIVAPLFAGSLVPAAAQPVPEPVDVTRYTFDLTLTDASNRIDGAAEVTIRFTEEDVSSFALDLVGHNGETGMTVESVTRGGTPLAYTHRNNVLRIDLADPAGIGALRAYNIEYHGVPADGLIISENMYGDRTFFGDNWPERARHWLPTNDHPSDKAVVDFVITAPAHYRVVANGRLVEQVNLEGEWERTHWSGLKPMPTYGMVIGVAPFAVEHVGEYLGTPVQSWVFPENREAGFYDFARAERILAFFEGHIGTYPYVKLANVQSRTRFGGMENPSAIFYNEQSITGTRSNELLLAHEIVHQWFGNAVTAQRWPHFWLCEGFATYLGNVYMGYTYGRDSLEALMQSDRADVLAFVRSEPDEAVIDTTWATPIELLNANSYEKGGWILHMLRDRVGTSTFWDGLQIYFRRYKHGNATTSDFRQVMEEISGRELGGFFRQWARQPGVPVLAGGWSHDDGVLTVTIQQVQDGAVYDTPLDLGLVFTDEDMRTREVRVDERRELYTFEVERAPAEVVLDPHVQLLFDSQFDE